jgi:hypothetical protein
MKINSQIMGFGVGTKVLMADGKEKAIENIQSGDVVLSFDQFDAFGKLEPKKVLNTFMHVDRNLLKVNVKDSDVELVVALGQLFINSKSEWEEAVDTNELIDEEGNVLAFEVKQITRGKHQVFDIVVEDNHSLVANGIRVHNKKAKKKAGATKKVTTDDYDDNQTYNLGASKKKKVIKNYKPEPKVDYIVTAVNTVESIDTMMDFLKEIVDESTPLQLTQIKLTIQTSIDSIYNYTQQVITAINYSSISSYDKGDVLGSMADINSFAISLRKPFEETVVSAAGKTVAASLIELIGASVLKVNRTLSLYTVDSKEKDATKTKAKKKKFTASRAQDGKYKNTNPNQPSREGGARNDFGSDKGRGGGGKNNSSGPAGPSKSSSKTGSAGSSTRSTGGSGNKSTGGGLKDASGSAAGRNSGSIGGGSYSGGVSGSNPKGDKNTGKL